MSIMNQCSIYTFIFDRESVWQVWTLKNHLGGLVYYKTFYCPKSATIEQVC